MGRSRVFVLLSLAFAGGILIGSVFNITSLYVYLASAVFICLIPGNEPGSKKSIILLMMIFTCLGIWRINHSEQENQFVELFESKVSLEGVVVKDVDLRQAFQMLTVRPEGFSQNILVTATKTGQFFYGDQVWITGKITEAKEFNNFDYKGYLERQNIYALMKYPKVVVLKQHQAHRSIEELLKIKYLFVRQINKVLEEPYSSLLLGILIGARKTLPQEIIDNFNVTGTSHIIAISGYNISVIVGSLSFLVYLFGRRWSFAVTISLILIFVIISGASASVIRAAIMGGLLVTAGRIGRLYAITPALCFAALCMLVVNPKVLFWDAGFQLSFLATLGIIYGLPLLEEITKEWPQAFGLKTIFLTTFAATVMTLPLILLLFGRLSLFSLLVNMLVLPAVPPAMFFGFFSALPWIGAGFAFITHVLLVYIVNVTRYFAGFEYSALTINMPRWGLYLLYSIILSVYVLLKHRAYAKIEKNIIN